MTPLDRMILRAVRCLDCGAAYGECDCAAKHQALRDAERAEFIEAEYQRLMALPDDALLAECAKIGVKPTER